MSLPPLSVLDLAPIPEGADAAAALARSVALARQAEASGYRRFWLAEHHNMDGVACSSTAVLVGHVAGSTQRIRVGSGGIMLPNHAPLTVAEAFGTLATLYPERIDLGLGRAPGTDMATARALRRHLATAGEDDFAQDVQELMLYLEPAQPGQQVRAIPGQGTRIPIWILGSSLYGAQLAAYLGLPYAFASHFAPDLLLQALDIYRRSFRPSARWTKPHAMVAVNAVAADSDEEAAFLATSLQQRFLSMQRGVRGPLPRPVDPADFARMGSAQEHAGAARMYACSAVGAPDTLRAQLREIVARTQADELIIAGAIHDDAARLKSCALVAEVAGASATT